MNSKDKNLSLNRARSEIVFEQVVKLKSDDEIQRVELPIEFARQIGDQLRKFYVNKENNLLALLCPPGQEGGTRFIDTAIEISPEDASGDYNYYLSLQKAELGLGDSELIGFASIFPVRDRMVESFEVGHKIWISLGDKILESIWNLGLTDPTTATVWAKSGDEIKAIQAIAVE